MLKVVLVDDELPVLGLLERMVMASGQVEIVGSFTNAETALREILSLKPDAVFLDVSMPRMNGIELATRLVEQLEQVSIVFVTAYEQYAVHAFQLHAVHYLLKPVTKEAVMTAIQRIPARRSAEPPAVHQAGDIVLFGHMHLRQDGKPSAFLTSKIEELLALLIVHRERGISKWVVMDLLWSNSSLEKSQQNLYTMIFRLKKLLKSSGFHLAIQLKGSVYTLNISGVFCDLIEFERFALDKPPVNEETIPDYEQAISLYRGDFLGDKDYMWSISYREKYYQQFCSLVGAAASYYAKHQKTEEWKDLQLRVKPLLIEEDYEDLLVWPE